MRQARERRRRCGRQRRQSATADNLWELQRDADLVRRGWQVERVFKDSASQPLLDALDNAGIKYKLPGQ